jgi:patatin-related protein
MTVQEMPDQELPDTEPPNREMPAQAPAAQAPPAPEPPAPEPPAAELPAQESSSPDPQAQETPAQETPVQEMPAQELRLAITMSGGVSLAVWMGGVARELNLLTEASDRSPAVPGEQPGDTAVRGLYRKLLDLMQVTVSIDVLAGTSAGGINAALLGLAAVGRCDLAGLRRFWIDCGSLTSLLRDPRVADPPSLLQGDGRLLADLRTGIGAILRPPPDNPRPLPTDVFVTTTLLSAEATCFTDDYGTVINAADHHGLFHFTQDDLRGDILGPLSLAGRSSASFPGAFEASFVPRGAKADATHPDMAAFSNLTIPHWAADGGLMDNNPIGPLLQTVFERTAGHQVRRALLYVTPTSGPPAVPPPELFSSPPGLARALLSDLNAAMSQSIATDLATIRDHNDRVAARLASRLRLAELSTAAQDGRQQPLVSPEAWADYRRQQSERLARPLVTEVLRQVATTADKPAGWALGSPGAGTEEQSLAAAMAAITADWPASLPTADLTADDAASEAARLGPAAWDAAMAIVLDLLKAGFVLATDNRDHRELGDLVGRVHDLAPVPPASLRKQVTRGLDSPVSRAEPLPEVTARLAREHALAQAGPAMLARAWAGLAAAVTGAFPLLARLAAQAPDQPPATGTAAAGPAAAGSAPSAAGSAPSAAGSAPPASAHPTRPSAAGRSAQAARQVRTYLAFLGDGTTGTSAARTGTGAGGGQAMFITRLLSLHVLDQSIQPKAAGPDQPVELIEVSAVTRTSLDPARRTASAKLTGMQIHHFGAFFKASWRANDWMWGRLDGAGWLVHVLLDPRRILAVLQAEAIPAGQRAEVFLDRLQQALDPADPLSAAQRASLLAELNFLGEPHSAPMPASLPGLALWAATALQRHIAADELAEVARQIEASQDGKPTSPEQGWLNHYHQAAKNPDPERQVREVAALLPSCPVPAETIAEEARAVTPLFLRTVAQAGAVAVGVVTSVKKPAPVALRAAFQTIRAISLTAYTAIDQTHGVRRKVILAGLGLMVAGVLAMLTHTIWLGLPGLVIFGAGAVMALIATWRSLPWVLAGVTAVAVALIAAAPWLPWLDSRLFSWIKVTFVPFLNNNKWAWTVFFLFVLIPPVMALAGLVRHRRPQPSAPQRPQQPAQLAPGPPPPPAHS